MCLSISVDAQERPSEKEDLTGPTQTFDPSHQRPISYLDRSVEVTLMVGHEGDSLRIRNLRTKARGTVPLPQELAQVDEIRAGRNGKLVVRGMVNGSGSEIVVIDTKSASVIDKFLCYLPSISPDGEYIAFIKFYPLHFSEGTDDHYMLYDLDKMPSENRPADVPPDDWENVGVAFYPIGVANEPRDNVRIAEDSRHEGASRLFWISNGKELLFADRAPASEGEIDLVLADIGMRGDVTIRIARQHAEPLCSTLKDPKRARSCSLLVRKVEFHPDPAPSFAITFLVVDLRKLVSLDLSLSQFRPSE